MAWARNAANGFERLVTRSLAIVAIAVAAGAAHSWMHGPLNPTRGTSSLSSGQTKTPTGNATNSDPAGTTSAVSDTTGTDTDGAVAEGAVAESTDIAEPDTVAQSNNETGNDGAKPNTVTPEPVTPEPAVADALPDGHITVAQAYDHFVNGTADFIDARPADEYAEGHIPGALNLSLQMTQDSGRVNDVFKWLDTSRPIVVYCRGGLCSEAKDVGRLLSGANFAHILILADGLPGWKDAGYTVDTGSGQ